MFGSSEVLLTMPRSETVYPEPHALVANIDTAFMQQVLHIPKRQRKSDVNHHRELDDFGRRFEVTEWISGHQMTLVGSS